MEKSKRKRLEKAGYIVTDTQEFLGLSDAEMALIEMKISLASALAETRKKRKRTQAQLAKTIGSSQSRVAKMEAGDASISFELILKALLALGATPSQIARRISQSNKTAAPRRRKATTVASS